MAAVPKKKPSETRRRIKHSAWRKKQINAQMLTLVTCKSCGARKYSHRVCPECGKYKGQILVEPKTKVKRVSATT